VLYIYWNYILLVILQENIDTATVERVEKVGEEDCIKVETEEDFIQLVRTVKTEEEVSVVCFVVVIYLQVCVCVCIVCSYAYHISLFCGRDKSCVTSVSAGCRVWQVLWPSLLCP
jgi:hypothetical protein